MLRIQLKRDPYIIAEAGVNHNGSLQLAKQLVDMAVEADADCVKFQAFSADELIVKGTPQCDYQQVSGDADQYDMLKKLELPESDFEGLAAYCDARDIDFMATPFSVRWVKFLDELGVPMMKIASGNLQHTELLEAAGATELPVLFSIGMTDYEDISGVYDTLYFAGATQIGVMQCTTLYPTPLKCLNLEVIRRLSELYSTVGLSDHSTSMITGAAAVGVGATVLEKHITLDCQMAGPDHASSLDAPHFGRYVEFARSAHEMLGSSDKVCLAEEKPIKELVTMSVVAAREIKAGTVITSDDLTVKRPGTGVPANQIDRLIGATAGKDIKAGEIFSDRVIQLVQAGA